MLGTGAHSVAGVGCHMATELMERSFERRGRGQPVRHEAVQSPRSPPAASLVQGQRVLEGHPTKPQLHGAKELHVALHSPLKESSWLSRFSGSRQPRGMG